MIEISVLLFSQTRRLASNGANLTRLGSILGGQVFMSSILGVRTLMQFHFGHMRYLLVLELCATFIGLAIVIYALLFAPTELKLFKVFCFRRVFWLWLSIILLPLWSRLPGQWELLRIPGFGCRYYFFPMLAFFTCLIWMVTNTTWTAKLPRRAALLILLLSPIGILRDWRYKPFVDFNFPKYVAMFERAAPGTRVVNATNPIWTDWTI